jgi:2-oxoacid:acceptor oxidoreductase gamma subunit (pyruvate/2-ketoisovalerate family)
MLEIKFSGRGGQGVVMASQMLGAAFFRTGMYPQCYSLFGGERRGAPVVGFLRVDTKKIRLKCEIRNPNELVVFDPSLLDADEIRSTIAPGSPILVNAKKHGQFADILSGYRIGIVDGQGIAESTGLGHAANTAILGAYCRFTENVPLEDLIATIKDMAPAKKESNLEAALLGFENLTLLNWKENS